jgi:hypothetical protein
MLHIFRLPKIITIEELPAMDDATKQQHKLAMFYFPFYCVHDYCACLMLHDIV